MSRGDTVPLPPGSHQVIVPPGREANFRDLITFASDLADHAGLVLLPTSFWRPGTTNHSPGRALDVGIRSDPWYAQAQAGKQVLYRSAGLIELLRRALTEIAEDHPRIRRVVVELDHLHLDLGNRADPGYIPIFLYGPGRCNELGCDPGIGPLPREV